MRTIRKVYYYKGAALTDRPRNYETIPPVEVSPRLGGISDAQIGVAVVLGLVADANTGTFLGEIDPVWGHVSWLLNDYGEAEMQFSARAEAITGGLVRAGRRLVLQFDNGLPDWGGIIDVPIDNDGLAVTVRAFEATYILKQRVTAVTAAFSNLSPAAVLAALLETTNATWPTGIELQIDDPVDGRISPEYHLEYIHDVLHRDIAPFCEYWMEPVISNQLSFRLHVSPVIGRDLSDRVVLMQGVNTDRPKITTQGPIINQWQLAGSSGVWGSTAADGRALATVESPLSIERYGLRQGRIVGNAGETEDELTEYGDALLEGSAEPYTAIAVSAMNLPPARFRDYRVGDTVGVELYEEYGGLAGTGGFQKKRVLGRELNVRQGVCEVILQ